MIVQTHTPEQVVQEAVRDLPAMWNKLKEPLERVKRRVRKDKHLRLQPQLFEYRSHAGNNWLVGILPTKKMLQIVPFVWYRGTDGLYRAARIMHDGISCHISHHVLEQYAARFNRTGDGLTRLKEFVRENMNFGIEQSLIDDEVRIGVTTATSSASGWCPSSWRSSSPSWTMASSSPSKWNRWSAWTSNAPKACATAAYRGIT